MKNYNLFLDDVRMPMGVHLYDSKPIYKDNKDWVIVRNYNDFINCIIDNGLPNIVSFDHDLGDFDQYGNEKTGYDCVKWLVDYCIDNNLGFPDYMIHSMNTVGDTNMVSYIENFKKRY